MRPWAERVAVVTGAGSGIGRALAVAFAERGARLVLADLEPGDLEETRAALPGGSAAELVQTDVSDAEQVEALAEAAFALGGAVDLLCNNAGVGCNGRAWEQSREDWRWLLDVNLMGVVHGLQSFVPRMLGQGVAAHVLNTSSMMGLLSAPGLGAYAATKHAVVALTEALRMDLESEGAEIGVSVLCPGPVNTRVFEQRGRPAGGDQAAALAQRESLGAVLAAAMEPAEVARVVLQALDEGRFFVFSSPEYVAGTAAREAQIRRDLDAAREGIEA